MDTALEKANGNLETGGGEAARLSLVGRGLLNGIVLWQLVLGGPPQKAGPTTASERLWRNVECAVSEWEPQKLGALAEKRGAQ